MTSLSGLIRPIVRSMTVDRRDIVLPVCWVRRRAGRRVPVEAAPFVQLSEHRAKGDHRDLASGEAVAFLLGPAPPDAAIDALLAAADRRARVYVLASPEFGEGRKDPGLKDRARAHVLVRWLKGLPLSGVMSDRGTRAGLWLGDAPRVVPCWWLPLSSAQGKALFSVFLHLFWHHAKEEAWTGKGPLSFRKAAERPFDAPSPHPTAPVRLFLDDAPPLDGSAGDVLYLPGAATPGDARRPAILFTPPSGAGQEQLTSFLRLGTRVVWEDLGLPAFRVGTQGGVIEAASDVVRVRIALENAQAEGLRRAAALAEQHATFRLSAEAKLGAIEGDVWLPGQPEPAPLIPVSPIEAPATEAASLRAMENTSAYKLPEPPILALHADYRWNVIPPRAPLDAIDDPLVVAWQEFNTAMQKRIGDVHRRLVDMEHKQSALARSFTALAGALLGFRHQRSGLLKEIDALAAEHPSLAEPEAAHRLFERLINVEEAAIKLDDEMAAEERKEREKQEREEQEGAWRTRRQEAARALEAARAELSTKKDELERIEAELGELSRGNDARDPKDREARKKLLWDDKKRLADRIRKIKTDIDLHTRISEEAFEYRPARSALGTARGEKRSASQARFVPQASARSVEQNIPKEALPNVGKLLRGKEARYLVIARWEELDDGEREAQRLGARLVAPTEDT